MKLTKTQVDIVEHRLEVPDAIYDAIEQELLDMGIDPSDNQFSFAVEQVSQTIKGEFDINSFESPLQFAIFEDAIIGSTYVDATEDDIGFDISQQKFNAIERSYDNLLDKLEELKR